MNVVIYARYSSHNQTEQSIEGQIAICEEYAKRNNYTIVGTYIDRALTGTNDNRPQFKQMIEDSNKKYFNGVLVYQLDRFARNRYDSATYKSRLKKNDVRVFSAKENISEDASGILMESVLEGMAEYYSAELSQKVRRGMKINAEKCQHNGGIPALGYDVDKNKKYTINKEQANTVRKIFDMYINGNTMTDIIKYLNENNIKTSYNNQFNKNSIRRILLNKKYIGTYICGEIEISNGMPQIIDNETFNKAQEIMQINKKAPARAKSKAEYLLTTKLFCGHCKEMMVGVSGTSKTGKKHNYYSCNGTRKKVCDKKNISKDYIEDFVVNKTKEILTDDNINQIASSIVKVAEKEKSNDNIKRLQKELKDNEKQKENLFVSLKICEFDNVRKSIFEEINKMEEQRKQLEKEIAFEKLQHVNITFEEIVFFLKGIKEGNMTDIRYRKMLINTFIYKIYSYDNDIIIISTLGQKSYAKIPDIYELESSFMGNSGTPNVRH